VCVGTDAGTAEQKRQIERKRNIIVLIHQHLVENGGLLVCSCLSKYAASYSDCIVFHFLGYIEAAERLQKEAGIACSRFEVADNVDLQLIYSEYESYYELKFDKKPKVVKKLRDDEEPKRPIKKAAAASTKAKPKPAPEARPDSPREGEEDLTNPNLPLSMQGMLIRGSAPAQTSLSKALNIKKNKDDEDVDLAENRLLRPLPAYGGDKEMRTLCDVISREIYQESPDVKYVSCGDAIA
jgi:katanin p60 ATPase-containing subunit A1